MERPQGLRERLPTQGAGALSLAEPNLIDADLSHADLCGAQMARAQLSQATLRGRS